MFESFPHATAERLNRRDYHADFYRHFEGGIDRLNKLERGQHFQERGFPSWEAFAAGEWERALSLVEEKRPVYTEQFRRRAELGVRERRLRVVEFPVTPYVQWEFPSCGCGWSSATGSGSWTRAGSPTSNGTGRFRRW